MERPRHGGSQRQGRGSQRRQGRGSRPRRGKMGLVTVLPHVPVGATWRCIDIHLHSPGVPSFALAPGTDLLSPEGRAAVVDQYVAQLVRAGIEIGVLTDYQGVRPEWFGSATPR